MHDELKPLVSMYHCCVEADERSKDQHNVLSAEDSVDQKFHGSTRSLMGAFLWVAIVFLVIGRRQQCRRLPTSSIRRSKKNPQTHPSAFPTTSESAHSRGPEGTLVCAIINYNFTRNEFCDGAGDDYERGELQLSFGPSVANFRRVFMEIHHSEKKSSSSFFILCLCFGLQRLCL